MREWSCSCVWGRTRTQPHSLYCSQQLFLRVARGVHVRSRVHARPRVHARLRSLSSLKLACTGQCALPVGRRLARHLQLQPDDLPRNWLGVCDRDGIVRSDRGHHGLRCHARLYDTRLRRCVWGCELRTPAHIVGAALHCHHVYVPGPSRAFMYVSVCFCVCVPDTCMHAADPL